MISILKCNECPRWGSGTSFITTGVSTENQSQKCGLGLRSWMMAYAAR